MKHLLRSTALALALGFFLPAPGPISGVVFDPAAYADPFTGKIPDWISTACCGPSDAHQLRMDQARENADGTWTVDGYPWPVKPSTTKIDETQDNHVWAFYQDAGPGGSGPLGAGSGTGPSHMYCLFISRGV